MPACTHKGQEQFEVESRNDSLFAILPAVKLWLKHYHYDVFQLYGVDKKTGIDTSEGSGLKIMFHMDEAGRISKASLPLETATQPIEFTRTAKANLLQKDSLQKYTGDYLIGGVEIKVYLKGDEKLYLFVPGQPEYELVNEEKDKFGLKILDGYHVQFNSNNKGEISELLLIQPNGTFKATRKVKL